MALLNGEIELARKKQKGLSSKALTLELLYMNQLKNILTEMSGIVLVRALISC
jgi:hypothetical protein